MLRQFVEQICADLKIDLGPNLKDQKSFTFNLNPTVQIVLTELNPGVSMRANISPCPEKKREELFLSLMKANFLGQGTAGARIGLDRNEKFLTLSLGLPYELNYQSFKEHLEDFVNHLTFWQSQMMKFEREETLI